LKGEILKYLLSSAIVALALFNPYKTSAQEVTLVAPGRMRCPINRMTPDFERKTGHTIKATIASGGITHQQVVRGEPFDVPIVAPPYQDILTSGNVVANS
jgi:ABC-type molybdate transport system substrate-binding protein